MRTRGHTLRFTAMSVLVVLALTGFSTSRHGGHHGTGGSGGGCSSSQQDHDTSSTSGGVSKEDDSDDTYSGGSGSYRDPYDDSDDTYDDDSGSGSGTAALEDATVKLVSCPSDGKPYSTAEVANPNDTAGVFAVTVAFMDVADAEVVSRRKEADVPANGKVTVKVNIGGGADRVAEVDHCDPDPAAPPVD